MKDFARLFQNKKMHKELLYGLLLVFLLFNSCKKNLSEEQMVGESDKDNILRNSSTLPEQWMEQNSIFKIRNKESSLDQLIPTNLSEITDYKITIVYKRKLSEKVSVKKIIDFEPITKYKITESDIYIKSLNKYYESRLHLSYDYVKKEYYSDLMDSTATIEKHRANKIKADSMMNYAKKNGLYLCGTAYSEILDEGILLVLPIEIKKDSALKIVTDWIKE